MLCSTPPHLVSFMYLFIWFQKITIIKERSIWEFWEGGSGELNWTWKVAGEERVQTNTLSIKDMGIFQSKKVLLIMNWSSFISNSFRFIPSKFAWTRWEWGEGLFDCSWSEHNQDFCVTASGDGSLQMWDLKNPKVSYLLIKTNVIWWFYIGQTCICEWDHALIFLCT